MSTLKIGLIQDKHAKSHGHSIHKILMQVVC